MAEWIDFKVLRRELDFAVVLASYGVVLKGRGDQHYGFCPLPTHKGRKRSPSFSANFTRGVWHCFGCGAKGNVLDFAARMEGFNPTNRDELRQAALIIEKRFSTLLANASARSVTRQADNATPTPSGGSEQTSDNREVVVNAPMKYGLRELDPRHPYLVKRRLTPRTIAHFGLGYSPGAIMRGRIAIPLHDNVGELIGYAGRRVDDNETKPKYLFPSKRVCGGKVYEFRKSAFLYNANRLWRPVYDLVIVEGFPAVWWLHQIGYFNVVAVMGSSCSREQAAIIVNSVMPTGRIWIFPDGDEAGARCAESVLVQVASQRFCRWIKLDAAKQPTDCTSSELSELLQDCVSSSTEKEKG